MSLLLVPSVRRGNGSGHLSRCFALALELQHSPCAPVDLYIPPAGAAESWTIDTLRLAYPAECERLHLIDTIPAGQRYGLVLLDQRNSRVEDYRRWAAYGTVVGIDEGGPARDYLPYLVDMLPQPEAAPANCTRPGLLCLPENRRKEAEPQGFTSILLSFGGEDRVGLAGRALRALERLPSLADARISIVSGPLDGSLAPGGGLPEPLSSRLRVERLGPVPRLRESFHSYDLVLTHFGLTAYEAAWAGCAVLLLNPSHYHEGLARAAGFVSLGVVEPDRRRLAASLADPAALFAKTRAVLPDRRESATAFFCALKPVVASRCPACGQELATAGYRSARKTYYRCPDCRIVSMAYFQERHYTYTQSSYFFEEYRAQYGRTYVEDLPKLRAMALHRLRRIEALLPACGPQPAAGGCTVLDIGCAYGAFVAEAQARHWNAVGSDLSAEAVAYVQRQFQVPALVADFASPAADGLYPRQVDCLTMWYVVEHFAELSRVLRRVNSLLRVGGVFAFSTPNGRGVSGRFRPAGFYEQSPDDHWTVWDPDSARRVLRYFGFEVKRVVVTGHHPERFPGRPARPGSLRYRLYLLISRLFGLGDTFECYAVKSGPATR